MDTLALKRSLPTFYGFWERRRKAAHNRLPKHLRPPARWPIALHIALNLGIIAALGSLIFNIDDFTTDAVPAVVMIICVLMLFYTVINGLHLNHRFKNIDGHRWAKINFALVIIALMMWPATVAYFLR